MSKNNYSNFFNRNKIDNTINNSLNNAFVEQVNDVIDEQVNDVNTNAEIISVEEPETVEEIQETNEDVSGYVIDCKQLYVRKEATVDSEHLCIVNKDDELKIDLDKSTIDFFKVTTISGIEGYCMKKYVAVR